jgi:hypothetical protein
VLEDGVLEGDGAGAATVVNCGGGGRAGDDADEGAVDDSDEAPAGDLAAGVEAGGAVAADGGVGDGDDVVRVEVDAAGVVGGGIADDGDAGNSAGAGAVSVEGTADVGGVAGEGRVGDGVVEMAATPPPKLPAVLLMTLTFSRVKLSP